MTSTAEVCTCGTELIVKGRLHDGTPVTWCTHCDVPTEVQPGHPMRYDAKAQRMVADADRCQQCYRYDHHRLRIFPPAA